MDDKDLMGKFMNDPKSKEMIDGIFAGAVE